MKTHFLFPCNGPIDLQWDVIEAGEPKSQGGGTVTAYLVRSGTYWNVVAAGAKPGEPERIKRMFPGGAEEAAAREAFAKIK